MIDLRKQRETGFGRFSICFGLRTHPVPINTEGLIVWWGIAFGRWFIGVRRHDFQTQDK